MHDYRDLNSHPQMFYLYSMLGLNQLSKDIYWLWIPVNLNNQTNVASKKGLKMTTFKQTGFGNLKNVSQKNYVMYTFVEF